MCPGDVESAGRPVKTSVAGGHHLEPAYSNINKISENFKEDTYFYYWKILKMFIQKIIRYILQKVLVGNIWKEKTVLVNRDLFDTNDNYQVV